MNTIPQPLPAGGDPGAPVSPRDVARACEQVTDQELCDTVRAGVRSESGRAAFAELYRRYVDIAMGQAYRSTGDRDLAERLVAESFTKVLQAMDRGKGPHESFLGYLLIALRAETIHVAMRERASVAVDIETLDELIPAAPDHADQLTESDQLTRAYAAIPESWQRVLWLLEVEQVSVDEVGERLNLKPAAVRQLSFRARKGLGTAYLQQYVQAARPQCAATAGDLAEYTRDSLGKRRHAAVTRHVSGCEHCAAQVSRLSRIADQLRVLVGPILIGGAVAGAVTATGGGASSVSATTLDPVGLSTVRPAPELAASSEGVRVAWRIGMAAAVLAVIAGVFLMWPRPEAPREALPVSDVVSTQQPSPSPVPSVVPLPEVLPTSVPSPEAPAPSLEPGPPVEPWVDDTTPFWNER